MCFSSWISTTSGVEQLKSLLDLSLVDGFIIINRQYDETIDQYFQKIHIPHVYLIYYLRGVSKQKNIVDTDNFAAGYLAAKHLLELGHREIATVTMRWEEYTERTNGGDSLRYRPSAPRPDGL